MDQTGIPNRIPVTTYYLMVYEMPVLDIGHWKDEESPLGDRGGL